MAFGADGVDSDQVAADAFAQRNIASATKSGEAAEAARAEVERIRNGGRQ